MSEPSQPTPPQELSEGEVAERVMAKISEMQKLPREKITVGSTFEELGVDSLIGFELLCDLEDDLDITIPDEVARELTSVKQVVEQIRIQLAGSDAASSPDTPAEEAS